MFVSHKTRISGEFDLRKDLYSMKLFQRLEILLKLHFTVLWDSELPGLCSFDNMVIWLKEKRGKNQKAKLNSGDNNPWSNFCDPHWEFICHNN